MWTAFGIMLGTAFNLAVFYVPDINWRLMLGERRRTKPVPLVKTDNLVS